MTSTLTATSCIQYTTMPEPGMDSKPQPWGWHLVLNLYECDPEKIQSAEAIYDFVVELCELIEMRRFGEPMIVNFGEDPRVTGYSLLQLIETSNICGHFANESNAAYLDIFSCKKFDPEVATAFCIKAFEAQKASGTFISRD
jgi:S-adenosylmethionine/arginine decarboxylase-like enzyme